MQTPAPTRYTATARLLHWVVAVTVVGQLTLGFWMKTLPNTTGVQAQWFNLHKSIGITLGCIILLRLAWRLTHPAPPLPETIPAWQRKTAKIVHALLYVCLLVIPISGFVGSSVTKYPIRFYGHVLPKWLPESPAVKELCSQIHMTAVGVFIILAAVHIGKVLKHLLLDRDEVFSRMGWLTRRGNSGADSAREFARSK